MTLELPSLKVLGDRYEIQSTIGRGGVGSVYRAIDRETDQEVAIKQLGGVFVGTKVERRFLREGQAMRSLRHPNIVAVFDVVRTPQQVFMVMELMDRGSCHALARRKKGLPVSWCLHIAESVLAGLQRVHAAGWVHRDLKPGNLLLNAEGVVKISDFGILRHELSDLTQPGMTLGTGAYMAPEQSVDARQVTPQADLFSLGATLYALNTNRVPLNLATGQLRVDKPQGNDPLARLDRPLRALVRRACAWEPKDRFASASDMRRAVREIQQLLRSRGER